MSKAITKIIDWILLFSWFFMIILLLFVMFWAAAYYNSVFWTIEDFSTRMFYVAILICIVTVFAQWISGRMDAIKETIHNIKGGNNYDQRRKPKEKWY